MTGYRIRRAVAVLAAATLTASFAVTALAAEVEAAKPKPKCLGQVATIVGTRGPDVLVGTAGPDVIVGLGGNDIIDGRGGNDLICGGTGADRLIGKGGRDRLYGNAGPDKLFGGFGPDRLFGGVGNDLLAGQVGSDLLGGGPGTDTCYQGQGAGQSISCELPAPPPVVAPAPPAAPAPPPPTPTPTVLVIAYSDLDGSHTPTSGDVMISQIVDTNLDGTVSAGDTIEMGMYPTTAAPTSPSQFVSWGVKSHSVIDVTFAGPTLVEVDSTAGTHEWWRGLGDSDDYYEHNATAYSDIWDLYTNPGDSDIVEIDTDSPSHPATTDFWTATGTGDDKLVDVEFYF